MLPTGAAPLGKVADGGKTHDYGQGGLTGTNGVRNCCFRRFIRITWGKKSHSNYIINDFYITLSTGWNELLIASFSHRSISVKDGILLATGLHVHRNSAHSAGVGAIFDR